MTTQVVRIAYIDQKNPLVVEATSDEECRTLWFTSDPLEETFCNRVIELQLNTFSSDQGYEIPAKQLDSRVKEDSGSCSWFEIAVLSDPETKEIKTDEDGREMRWRSHCNALARGRKSPPMSPKLSAHFGNVFDSRDSVILDVEKGDVLAVYACVKSAGWKNLAQEGELFARVLEADATSLSWSLKSTLSENGTPNIRGDEATFTLVPEDACDPVEADGPDVESAIWFTSPVLTESVAKHIEEIQLFTTAYNQDTCDFPDQGMWTWFDFVILKSAKSDKPKLGDDGRELVWKSHDIDFYLPKEDDELVEVAGPVIDRSHDLIQSLRAGDILAIRVCARFRGWASYAHDARLVVRISREVSDPIPREPEVVDWKNVAIQKRQLIAAGDAYFPSEAHITSEVVERAKKDELRRDELYGADQPPIRLLSLDGGGVRGISSLLILKDIMAKVAGDPNAKPCEYFDMIGGTSTGGIIALMLGRLKMSIDECIKEYKELSKQIFSGWAKSKFVFTGKQYDSSKLVDKIQDVIKRYSPNHDGNLSMRNDDPCKVFVVACNAERLNGKVFHLRTYYTKLYQEEPGFENCPIWKAAQATSAAPGYFSEVEIDGKKLIDGGVTHNNPTFLLTCEARQIFGYARPVECLISLGTGINPDVVLPKPGSGPFALFKNLTNAAVNFDAALAKLPTDTDIVAADMEHYFPDGIYYRFNVAKRKASGELEKPSDLAEWKDMPAIEALTRTYLGSAEESARVSACGKKLPPKHGDRAKQG